MNTVTIPKREYNELLKRDARMKTVVRQFAEKLKEFVEDDVELRPEVAARIERRARAMDAGKGKRFKNMREFRAYLRSL